jgi:hypothetical protein
VGDSQHASLRSSRELQAAAVVAAALLAAYLVTLAPGVTYWDAGEFLAAIKTLGIPHPPGTPLFILVANVWSRIFGPVLGFAYSVNLLSAVSTALACGMFAWLMARWTSRPLASIAGGVCAGLMSSVWMNANETEVYSPSLLFCILLLVIAQKASETRQWKWFLLFAYLCGLAWSLQLSALLSAPAAVVLALGLTRDRWLSSPRGPVPARGFLDAAGTMLILALLGASATLFMIVRAQHDPAINQGNPATWHALMDVITRRQYMPVPMIPRQAPWYIQLGNMFEYSDWQVALGFAPNAPPSLLRTPFTIVFALLGIAGCLWHRRIDAPSWRVMLVLFITATIGVVAYLNMKASPSFGYGFLPVNAKHEARERDYFFALGFACWGMWAGAGVVRVFARLGTRMRFAGLAIAVVPFFLNFNATDRAHGPEATAPLDSAKRILIPAPRNAVVFAYGDNDTYPVWYAQQVEGDRLDVTTVTIPLLGAEWYRAELARRHKLLTNDYVTQWRGFGATMSEICTTARSLDRPVVAKRVADRPAIPEACSD